MADRVSASITIGGAVPADQLVAFAEAIQNEGLFTEWGGEPFDLRELPTDGPLSLMAHEVAWGRFEELEAFCIEHGLPFARWSGGYGCEWGPERLVFSGSGEPQSYDADENDRIVISRDVVDRLGILEAIVAHFEAADIPIPPLVVASDKRERNDG